MNNFHSFNCMIQTKKVFNWTQIRNSFMTNFHSLQLHETDKISVKFNSSQSMGLPIHLQDKNSDFLVVEA